MLGYVILLGGMAFFGGVFALIGYLSAREERRAELRERLTRP